MITNEKCLIGGVPMTALLFLGGWALIFADWYLMKDQPKNDSDDED